MRVTGGRVFHEGRFIPATLSIENERFTAIEPVDPQKAAAEGSSTAAMVGDATVAQNRAHGDLAADGLLVIPGLIDVHFHGCMGHDFCEGTAEALHAIARYEASRGVTALCPTTMTFPEDLLGRVMDAARTFDAAADEAAFVGINMEGPFISHGKIGAQNPTYVTPCDAALFRRLQKRAGGLIKIVDIAPEEPGALEFTREVADEVRVSVAHTCANYDQARAAFEAGANHVTHLCNAMAPLHHRDPGPIAAAFDALHVMVELICDGVHIHPAMVRALFALFGDDRIMLISDTMEAAGLTDGSYELGGQEVSVKGNRATLASGTLAGSVTDLMGCLRTAVRDMGVPLETAVRAAALNPARALGIDHERGAIAPGMIADAVVLDEQLNVRHVIVRGRLLA
ncbi:N-acetylglucosamine-6-phosphate deacetylase [Berryella wangjianweii]|uniref:N-acetylglucosamine-6-phosphate deacetylase n=1 Tax=Berryella wangjianweii TaxID=2734634 RepID=A0A6M8JAN0_9ACTN|nr:N-acetylglucosamine-6-phosphate deacetylase [Berryella wangjianweii]